MDWFYLALLAPVFYAIVNLFDDNLLQFVYKSPYLATAFAGFFGTLPLVALFFRDMIIPGNFAAWAILAGFLTISYIFFYFKGLEVETPSIVIALFSLAPATIPFIAHYVVDERLTQTQILGFLIVLFASFGLAVIDVKKLKFTAALIPVIIAVIFMDAASIISKYVYDNANFFSAYMFFSIGMGLGGLMFLLIKFSENTKELGNIKRKIGKLLPIFIAAELTALAAEITLNLAISRGPVSLVKVIESIQPMFVLLFAVLLYPFAPKFFREAENGKLKKKFGLMSVAIIGLAIIAIQ